MEPKLIDRRVYVTELLMCVGEIMFHVRPSFFVFRSPCPFKYVASEDPVLQQYNIILYRLSDEENRVFLRAHLFRSDLRWHQKLWQLVLVFGILFVLPSLVSLSVAEE